MDWFRLEVAERRGFFTNHLLLGVIFVCFWLQWLADDRLFARLTLTGWSLPGLLTHPFIHVHSLHVGWNLLLLHVFGGVAVNAVGPFRYLTLFFLFALAGAAGHLFAGGGQAAGASGAICGFVGFVVVCRMEGTVSLLDDAVRVPVDWLALALIVKDVFFAFLPGMSVSVAGHLGGYLAGATVGLAVRRFAVW
ncbi:MAG: rhomboid family intramembrane serine protease [Limisphaerales bacterium]